MAANLIVGEKGEKGKRKTTPRVAARLRIRLSKI